MTRNWGCDCIFFFSYSSINRALSTSIFTLRMEAIFGPERAAALEAQMQSIKGSRGDNPALREEIILDALTAALEELNRGQTYVRTFRFKKGKRTSHMLVFVTKSPKGYRVMNEIMAKEGYRDGKGIPTFTHFDNPPSPTQLFHPEFDNLKKDLRERYAGKTRPCWKSSRSTAFAETTFRATTKTPSTSWRTTTLSPSIRQPSSGASLREANFHGRAKVTFPSRNK